MQDVKETMLNMSAEIDSLNDKLVVLVAKAVRTSFKDHITALSQYSYTTVQSSFCIPAYTYLYICIHICTYLCVPIDIYTYLYISIHIYRYLYISIHIYTYLYISIHISLSLSPSPSPSPSPYLSIYLSIYRSAHRLYLQNFLACTSVFFSLLPRL